MYSKGIFKFTDSIDKVLPIPNLKFADLAVLMSNYTKTSGCYNVFSCPIPPIN